jgi:endonuclease-3 related protein
MVGAILTQNTNWRNVGKAIENIKEKKLLDPHHLLKHRRMIQTLIKPSGFYRLKSKRLISFLEYFIKNYKGDVQCMQTKKTEMLRNELLNIPGIGYETADSILLYAQKRPIFVVDAYTRRIFSRHGVFDYDKPYDEIRTFFESNLPRSARLYNEYHALLVRVGKEFCRKHEPRCDACPLRTVFS